MYSHITVGTSDMERAAKFYDAALAPLGLKQKSSYRVAISYVPEGFSGGNEPFWVLMPLDRKQATAGNGVTVAFAAQSRAAVDRFHAAALASGGTDEGAPGAQHRGQRRP